MQVPINKVLVIKLVTYKPLPESKISRALSPCCVIRPQWVNIPLHLGLWIKRVGPVWMSFFIYSMQWLHPMKNTSTILQSCCLVVNCWIIHIYRIYAWIFVNAAEVLYVHGQVLSAAAFKHRYSGKYSVTYFWILKVQLQMRTLHSVFCFKFIPSTGTLNLKPSHFCFVFLWSYLNYLDILWSIYLYHSDGLVRERRDSSA